MHIIAKCVSLLRILGTARLLAFRDQRVLLISLRTESYTRIDDPPRKLANHVEQDVSTSWRVVSIGKVDEWMDVLIGALSWLPRVRKASLAPLQIVSCQTTVLRNVDHLTAMFLTSQFEATALL